MTADRDNIRFNAVRNALYHSGRRRALDRRNRVVMFLVVLLGAASAQQALALAGPFGAISTGVVIAALGALQLVFDFGGQARDHQILQRDYYALLAEIEADPEAEPAALAGWRSRLMRLAAEEPPVLRALDAKAYNDAIDATGLFDAGERLHIPLLHRALGGLFSFDGHSYAKIGERKAGG